MSNAEKAFRKVKAGVKWLSVELLLEPLKFDDLGAFQWMVHWAAPAVPAKRRSGTHRVTMGDGPCKPKLHVVGSHISRSRTCTDPAWKAISGDSRLSVEPVEPPAGIDLPSQGQEMTPAR